MDRTYVDTDDDDEEFDDAKYEEQEDNILNDVSAFMVSKANMSRYVMDQTAKHIEKNGNDKAKKDIPLIPNKILDS